MDDFDRAITFDALYRGYRKSKRNVVWKDSVAAYALNAMKNTVRLKEDIESGNYRISDYQRFMVHEPKEREIVATRFRDRQFQRSLCDTLLYREMTRGFVYDNCACQVGKGVDFALDRLETHLNRYYRKHGNSGWVLQCDIHHYFPDTPHSVAKAAVRKRVKEDRAYEMICDIIDSFEGEKGIGLGSQVSQLIELAVLDDLDHRIKERMRVKHYIRYMDDFILIHHDRETLRNCQEEISRAVEDMGLALNDRTQIYPLGKGIIFLKWRFILTDSGKVVRKICRKNVTKQRRKMKKLAAKIRDGRMPEEYLWTSFQSWRANARRGDTGRTVRRMEQLYNQLKGEIANEHHGVTGRTDDAGGSPGGNGGGAVREAGGAAGTETGGRRRGTGHAGTH